MGAKKGVKSELDKKTKITFVFQFYRFFCIKRVKEVPEGGETLLIDSFLFHSADFCLYNLISRFITKLILSAEMGPGPEADSRNLRC